MPSSHQHTLAAPIIFAGVGLHTGRGVKVVIEPAPADAGIVFVRTDLDDGQISARAENVINTRLTTVLGDGAGVSVSTVEHLLAAMAATEIDNAVVELDGPEVPIMDGSAKDFVQLIEHVGLRRQDAPRRYIEVLSHVEVHDGERRASLSPAPRLELALEIEFDSAVIGRQGVELAIDEASFRAEIADARTFGFLHEVEALRQMGLARGGSLENAVVVGAEGVINPEGLRRPDEFVRHKALDALGDLYLLGHPLIGRFEGVCAGHALHNALARALLARPDAWRLRELASGVAPAL